MSIPKKLYLPYIPFSLPEVQKEFFPLDDSSIEKPEEFQWKNEEEKISEIFEKNLLLNENIASILTNDIFTIQKELKDREAFILKATENCSFDIVVTSNFAFCLLKKLGEGQNSLVYQAKILTTRCIKLNGKIFTPTEDFAIKKSKKLGYSYSTQKKQVDSLNESTKSGIDCPLATFTERDNGHGFSLHRMFDRTLNQTEFHKMGDPINAILQTLFSILSTLKNLHKDDLIHRDIKGSNIFVSVEDNAIYGILSDCELLSKESSYLGKTTGTVYYLDPMMFGNITNTLINQKERFGNQTKAGDIFALGITIIYDLLTLFFTKMSCYSKNNKEIQELILKTKPQRIFKSKGNEPFWSKAELTQLGNRYPYRVMYLHCNSANLESMYIRPELKELRGTLFSLIDLFEDRFSPRELHTLRSICLLACDMQHSKLERRPSAKLAKTRVLHIYGLYKKHTINEFPFHEINKPILKILNFLTSSMVDLTNMHSLDVVHKDIRGLNIILVRKKKKLIGNIIQTGIASKEKTSDHLTTGTPRYLDPLMFGNEEETLIRQKQRYGRQTKEGDIFAFGLTIIYDILLKFLMYTENKSKNPSKVSRTLQRLEVKTFNSDFSDDQLRSIGRAYPFRSMYCTILDQIICYPKIESIRNCFEKSIKLFNESLTHLEVINLISLSNLACDMQEIDLKTRPSAKEVLRRLLEMRKLLVREEEKTANKILTSSIAPGKVLIENRSPLKRSSTKQLASPKSKLFCSSK